MPTTRQQAARQADDTSASTTAGSSTLSTSQRVLRSRKRPIAQDFITNDTSYRAPSPVRPDEPPCFTINLSLPPEQRYDEVCRALRKEMAGLTALFDDVMAPIARWVPLWWIRAVCRLFLRGVGSKEETRELRGISSATGVEMYLLVCFNVLLDLFMGCSSGAAAVGEDEGDEEGGLGWKMVHFRTLDWGMPALRKVVVKLDFVLEEGGPVEASSITYAGFVGVLTGVRKDLSMSLNFRPVRKAKGSFWPDLLYYRHLVLVLFGWRRGIASHLRSSLLPAPDGKGGWTTLSFRDVLQIFFGRPNPRRSGPREPIETTACYLCFCDGEEVAVLEKDRIDATIRGDCDFLVVTNSDQVSGTDKDVTSHDEGVDFANLAAPADALAELLGDAVDRQQCAERNWQNMRSARLAADPSAIDKNRKNLERSVMHVEDVVELVQRYPTTNECTHFACVMDPKQGRIRWCRKWKRPIGAKWIREHE